VAESVNARSHYQDWWMS